MFKFGASENIERFAQGLLYMNTLEHFVKLETTEPRMDLHEGTSHLLRGDGGILHMKLPGEENFKPVLEIHGPVRFRPDALQNVNVFCMFALRESASDTFVDPRTCDFGDTFALLIDFDKFMKRVNAAMPSTGQELQSDLVDYIDETSYLGPVGIFKKASRFSYQSEFRIALLPGTGAPFRLHVGNLSDIVIVGRLSQLNERLQVKVNAEGRRTLLISADSEGCRSAFRTDVDHDSEVMPISVPN